MRAKVSREKFSAYFEASNGLECDITGYHLMHGSAVAAAPDSGSSDQQCGSYHGRSFKPYCLLLL
ncbi:hypothetical protein E2C01_100591 [Portunus trituberculatus]|uniref:Uncharacterized protein n=1 Tax=Portunus trituberculatus TaxID=210409 RepID=A0A5B7KCL3_PORTR|nr:hypothetical protein [Portunus trituberculatus]